MTWRGWRVLRGMAGATIPSILYSSAPKLERSRVSLSALKIAGTFLIPTFNVNLFGQPRSSKIDSKLRHALYNGAGRQWLKEVAASSLFLAATGNSLDRKAMRDREAINRFCAFKLLGRKSYTSGDMDTFLAQGLRRLTDLSDKEREALRSGFDNALELNRELFRSHAFRRSLASSDPLPRHTPINISLVTHAVRPITNLSTPPRPSYL